MIRTLFYFIVADLIQYFSDFSLLLSYKSHRDTENFEDITYLINFSNKTVLKHKVELREINLYTYIENQLLITRK